MYVKFMVSMPVTNGVFEKYLMAAMLINTNTFLMDDSLASQKILS